MSKHNPFEPKSRAKSVDTKETETQTESKTEEPRRLNVDNVPDGSMEDVLEWVDNDPEKAKLAIEAEEAGKERKTLIKELKKV